MRCRLYCFLFILLWLPSAVLAQGSASLGDQVSGGLSLTPEEKMALDPVLAHYYALDGSTEVIKQVLQSAVSAGCRGDCLADLLALVNQAMESGTNCEQGGRDVIGTIRAVKELCDGRGIKPTGPEISRAVRAQFETKYRAFKETVPVP